MRVTVRPVCAVDICMAKRKYRLVRDWDRRARGIRNGSLAHPGATVTIRTGRGMRTVASPSSNLSSYDLNPPSGGLLGANISDLELPRGIRYSFLTQINN